STLPDSGSILVGGCQMPTPHARHPDSNWGTRVNCYAWAEGVDTPFCGPPLFNPPRNDCYGLFNGTSSASAIVAGAALVVQGVIEANGGQRLECGALRRLLCDPATGTASANPANDRIGVMPDLRKILTEFSLVPDVYARDALGDSGKWPALIVGASPDI